MTTKNTVQVWGPSGREEARLDRGTREWRRDFDRCVDVGPITLQLKETGYEQDYGGHETSRADHERGNLGVEALDGSTTYYRVDRPRAIPVKRRDQYGGRLEVPAPRWRFWVICGFGPAGSGKPAGSAAAAWRAWRRGASEPDRNATTARCYRAETWRAAEDADISAASGVAPDGGRWEGGE